MAAVGILIVTVALAPISTRWQQDVTGDSQAMSPLDDLELFDDADWWLSTPTHCVGIVRERWHIASLGGGSQY